MVVVVGALVVVGGGTTTWAEGRHSSLLCATLTAPVPYRFLSYTIGVDTPAPDGIPKHTAYCAGFATFVHVPVLPIVMALGRHSRLGAPTLVSMLPN